MIFVVQNKRKVAAVALLLVTLVAMSSAFGYYPKYTHTHSLSLSQHSLSVRLSVKIASILFLLILPVFMVSNFCVKQKKVTYALLGFRCRVNNTLEDKTRCTKHVATQIGKLCLVCRMISDVLVP